MSGMAEPGLVQKRGSQGRKGKRKDISRRKASNHSAPEPFKIKKRRNQSGKIERRKKLPKKTTQDTKRKPAETSLRGGEIRKRKLSARQWKILNKKNLGARAVTKADYFPDISHKEGP